MQVEIRLSKWKEISVKFDPCYQLMVQCPHTDYNHFSISVNCSLNERC